MSKTINMLPVSALALEGVANSPLTLDMGADFAPQVQAYIEGLGDPRGVKRVALVGQAVAAILALPALERLGGLPKLALVPFGAKEVACWFDTEYYRHNTCRELRDAVVGEAPAGYTVIDGGGRGMTPAQLEQLATELGCEVEEINVSSTNPGQVDLADLGGEAGISIAMGVKLALHKAGFPAAETAATSRLMFLPHGNGTVGVCQALALHGLTGAWPRTVRLSGTPATGFSVAEVVDPQGMRTWADGISRRFEAGEAPVSVFRDLLNRLIAGEESAREEARALLA